MVYILYMYTLNYKLCKLSFFDHPLGLGAACFLCAEKPFPSSRSLLRDSLHSSVPCRTMPLDDEFKALTLGSGEGPEGGVAVKGLSQIVSKDQHCSTYCTRYFVFQHNLPRSSCASYCGTSRPAACLSFQLVGRWIIDLFFVLVN